MNTIPRLRPTTLLCACDHVTSGFANDIPIKAGRPWNEIDPLALLNHEAQARLNAAWHAFDTTPSGAEYERARLEIVAIESAAQARYKGADDGV